MPIWLAYWGATPSVIASQHFCAHGASSGEVLSTLLQLLQQRTLYVQKHILPDLPNPVFDRVTRLCTATDCDPISISTARFDPTCYADRVLTLVIEER